MEKENEQTILVVMLSSTICRDIKGVKPENRSKSVVFIKLFQQSV